MMLKFWMHRETFVVWGLRITSFIILFILLLSFYWIVLDRAPPMENIHGQVIKYEPQQDGSWIFFVRWQGERKRLCWGDSKRWLADNVVLPLEDIPYPPDPVERPLGSYAWEVPIRLPPYFASTGHVSGTYRIRIFYACNPLQEYLFPIVVEPPPVPFSLPADAENGGPAR